MRKKKRTKFDRERPTVSRFLLPLVLAVEFSLLTAAVVALAVAPLHDTVLRLTTQQKDYSYRVVCPSDTLP